MRNDYQIGDWLYDASGVPKQVQEVYDDSVTLGGVLCHLSTVKPIPLTAGILQRNGWLYTGDALDYELVTEKWKITTYLAIDNHWYCMMLERPYRTTCSVDLPCDTVDRMQHILRICGEGKDIETL